MKIYWKISAQKTFPIFTNSLAPSEQELSTGSFRASTLCTSSRKQGIFLSGNSKIRTNNTPTARTADQNMTVNSWLYSFLFLRNRATKHPKTAAPNGGLLSKNVRATQTRAQVVYVIVHTWTEKHEPCSGARHAASWKRPSNAWVWVSNLTAVNINPWPPNNIYISRSEPFK